METQIQIGEIKAVGKHVYGSLYGCENRVLADVNLLKEIVIEAAKIARAKLVTVETYSIGDYNVVIGVVLESHISIHAWPSLTYATVDVFTCGRTNPESAFNYIIERLKPKKYTKSYVNRSNEL